MIYRKQKTTNKNKKQKIGLRGESNSGPLAPEARIIPLDHKAF